MTAKPTATKLAPAVAILLALFFLGKGALKLGGMRVDEYAAWGYPAWLQYFVGVVEVAAGLALFRKDSRFYGAIVVALLMVGAMFTLGRAGEVPQIAVPLVWLLLALFVAKASRRA